MALGDSYATITELKSRLGGVTGSGEDNALTNALAVASRGIEQVCGRQFNQATPATARVFYPRTYCLADVDDFYTTSGLVIATDGGNDGTYETTWTASDYQLEPLNGVVDGESGWPYSTIRAVAGKSFWFPTATTTGQRAPLQVTAQWGWSAVPAGVKEACLAVASETFALKDTRFGVGGVADWGTFRVRANPMAMTMIAPYIRDPVKLA